MTIKKLTSLSILLLVNTLILAHAIVPHHHHEDASIYFFSVYCEDCDETQHDEHHILTDGAYNTPDRKCIKNDCRSYTNCCCEQELNNLISNALNTQNFADDTIKHFRPKSCIFLFYTEFAVQSIGLRAPPAC